MDREADEGYVWVRRPHRSSTTPPVPARFQTCTGRDYRELFEGLLTASVDSIVLVEGGTRRFIEVSDSFCELTGFGRDELIGHTSLELGLFGPGSFADDSARQAGNGFGGLFETRIHRKDGEQRWVSYSLQLLGSDVLTILRDETARRAVQLELQRLADTDPLTSLLNRRRFEEEAQRALSEKDSANRAPILMLVDVDYLKHINDAHGHQVGDAVLCHVARVMRSATLEGDLVGRIGGDEFAILLTTDASEREAGVQARLEAGLRDIDSSSLDVGVSVSASVGLARCPEGGGTFGLLFHAADRALYERKRMRRHRADDQMQTERSAWSLD